MQEFGRPSTIATVEQIEEDDRQLAQLYHKRQELLRELNDIDSQIKTVEATQAQRLQAQMQARQTELLKATGDDQLDHIRCMLLKATSDQMGLREAQKAFEAASKALDPSSNPTQREVAVHSALRQKFVFEIFDHAAELMVDPHGNYFVQRVLSSLTSGGRKGVKREDTSDTMYEKTNQHEDEKSSSEILTLLESLGSDLGDICCNMHGTRAVQRLVDCLKSLQEFELFCDLIANDLVALIKDLNGTHAISRLLVSPAFMRLGEVHPATGMPLSESDPIREKGLNIRKDVYHIVAANCLDICRNRQGCCILQRCLQWAPEPFRSEIINAALHNTLKLVQDPFGNYVIQYLLDQQNLLLDDEDEPNDEDPFSVLHTDQPPSSSSSFVRKVKQQPAVVPLPAPTSCYTNAIIRQMLHNVASLSCNKFSSNVIEKCLKTTTLDVKQLLIDELTDPQALPKLLTDSFANYVIQTAIVHAGDDSQFLQLRDNILPLQHLLRNSPYGVKIEAKLTKRMREMNKKLGGMGGNNRNRGSRHSNHHHQHQNAMMNNNIAAHTVLAQSRRSYPSSGILPAEVSSPFTTTSAYPDLNQPQSMSQHPMAYHHPPAPPSISTQPHYSHSQPAQQQYSQPFLHTFPSGALLYSATSTTPPTSSSLNQPPGLVLSSIHHPSSIMAPRSGLPSSSTTATTMTSNPNSNNQQRRQHTTPMTSSYAPSAIGGSNVVPTTNAFFITSHLPIPASSSITIPATISSPTMAQQQLQYTLQYPTTTTPQQQRSGGYNSEVVAATSVGNNNMTTSQLEQRFTNATSPYVLSTHLF